MSDDLIFDARLIAEAARARARAELTVTPILASRIAWQRGVTAAEVSDALAAILDTTEVP